MRFVVDMNLSPSWTTLLRTAGHEALHWSEVGAADTADVEIATWADSEDRVVLTADLDFGTLLALSGRGRPSVVQLRCADTRHGTIGALVMIAISAMVDELRSGAFMTFDGQRARFRQLPFARH